MNHRHCSTSLRVVLTTLLASTAIAITAPVQAQDAAEDEAGNDQEIIVTA
jgi:hypothetical protein